MPAAIAALQTMSTGAAFIAGAVMGARVVLWYFAFIRKEVR